MCRPVRSALHRLLPAALIAVGALSAAPASAEDEEPRPAAAPSLRGEVETVPADSAWQGAPRAVDTGTSRPALAQRTMLWSGQGAWQLGLGVQQDAPGSYAGPGLVGAAPLHAPRLLFGASLDTSRTTQLRWRTPLPTSLVHAADEPRVMELSLVLKPSDPLANLRRGSLMKLELGGQTQLAVRPRGGKLTLRLTSQW